MSVLLESGLVRRNSGNSQRKAELTCRGGGYRRKIAEERQRGNGIYSKGEIGLPEIYGKKVYAAKADGIKAHKSSSVPVYGNVFSGKDVLTKQERRGYVTELQKRQKTLEKQYGLPKEKKDTLVNLFEEISRNWG